MKTIFIFLILFTNSFSAYLMTVQDSSSSAIKYFCVSSFSGSTLVNNEYYLLKFSWFFSDGSIATSYQPSDFILSIKDNYSFNTTSQNCISENNSLEVKKQIFEQYNIPLLVEPEPEPTKPINPFEPDENGLIMGMSEQNFNFAMSIYGVALSFLMSIGLIFSL